MKKAVFCWSGGKDSAYCLYKVLAEKEYDIRYLLTTVNKEHQRISMHGVRETLLEEQANQIGIPLVKVYVSEGTYEEYELNMERELLRLKEEGINDVIFGDIFLEDLRKYRENNLSKVKMNGVFPIWNLDTNDIINDFLSKQFKTIICCVNDGFLDEKDVGKVLDGQFIASLSSDVDPCGENGEFHTFCYDGPIFDHPIQFKIGERVHKPLDQPMGKTNGFWFVDLEA